MNRKWKQAADLDPAMLPKELQPYGQPLPIHRPWAAAVGDVQRKLFAVFGTMSSCDSPASNREGQQ
jgi:hypothetical protein